MDLIIVTLTFAVLFSILSFTVGALVVWVARDYIKKRIDAKLSMHPEMYDEDGNLLTDGLIAFHYEGLEDFLPDEFPSEFEET